jgi:predicted RNA-binding Zn ribbon-like protein
MATSEKFCIDAFLDFWQQKPGSPEGKMAEAYHRAVLDFDNRQTGLLKSIRPQKASGKLIPVFVEGSEQLIAGFEEAETHLAEVRADIEAYLALTDGQPSMSGLNDKLFRARRGIAEASLEARRTLERALRETNSSSMEEIEGVPAVQAAMDKKDQTQRQLEPVVEDLQGRISKVKAILEKYNKIVI